ncbi:MAG TPA: TIGR00645 family protein [Terriglobales bacterium]|nr:TIGR00645 family protein [Terriglobales bacterium]
MERGLEQVIFATRWLLLPFLVGLGIAMIAYLLSFASEVLHLVLEIFTISKSDALMSMLKLVDSVLVASLVIMVIIAGYESMISKLDVDAERHGISWLGKLDAGSLKVKVATSIVAISSIHLLQAFMEVDQTSSEKLMWLVIIHLTFVVSSLLLAVLDRLIAKH